jgi:hypothetical protein
MVYECVEEKITETRTEACLQKRWLRSQLTQYEVCLELLVN